MNNSAVFFGVTRFSVYMPGSQAWKLSSGSEESYLEQLYSDERLGPRFDIFLNYALPTYNLFSEKYLYKHILLYSEEMPQKWKNKLFSAKEKYPFLILQNVSGAIEFRSVMEEVLNEERSHNCPVAMFRVDDDDLLSKDYLERLSKYTDFPFRGMYVSFGSALAAKYSDGKFVDFRAVRKPLLSMGLACIGEYYSDSKKLWLPKSVNHTQTDKYFPVILDSIKPAFVWTHHEFQDSNQGQGNKRALSEIDKNFLSLKTVDSVDPVAQFPAIVNDYKDFLKNKTLLLDVKDPSAKGSESLAVSVNLYKKGSYRIFYDIYLDGVSNNNKGMVFFLGEQVSSDSELVGLRFSNYKRMGFYKYIPVESGAAKGHLDLYFSEDFDLNRIYIGNWLLKKDFTLRRLSIEYLSS